MGLFKESRCTNCFRDNTKPAESGGWICKDCGHWFGKGHR